VVVAGANVPDFKLLEATLDAIVVECPAPTEEAPQHLCLDKGYDKKAAREVVEERNYIPRYDRKLWIGDFLKSVVYLPFEQSNGKPTRQRRWEGDTNAEDTSG